MAIVLDKNYNKVHYDGRECTPLKDVYYKGLSYTEQISDECECEDWVEGVEQFKCTFCRISEYGLLNIYKYDEEYIMLYMYDSYTMVWEEGTLTKIDHVFDERFHSTDYNSLIHFSINRKILAVYEDLGYILCLDIPNHTRRKYPLPEYELIVGMYCEDPTRKFKPILVYMIDNKLKYLNLKTNQIICTKKLKIRNNIKYAGDYIIVDKKVYYTNVNLHKYPDIINVFGNVIYESKDGTHYYSKLGKLKKLPNKYIPYNEHQIETKSSRKV